MAGMSKAAASLTRTSVHFLRSSRTVGFQRHPLIITTNPLRHHTAGSTNVIMAKPRETRDKLYLDLLFIITVCHVDSHIWIGSQ
jgi:hypothetical protein